MVEEHGQDDDMELTQQLRARVVQMESDTVTDTLALRAGNERRALHRRLHRRLYRGSNAFLARFQIASRQKAS